LIQCRTVMYLDVSFSVILLIVIVLLYYCYSSILPYINIDRFEKKNKAKFLVVTDDFWSDKKFSLIKLYYKRYIIDIDDDEAFQMWFGRVIEEGIRRLDIVVHTYGGSIVSSDIIIKNLLDFDGTVNIYVPYRALSAGTRLMLVGDYIYMNDYSLASPMDPQVTLIDSDMMQFSVKSLLRYVDIKGIKKVRDTTGLQYIEHKKLFDDNIRILNMILKRKYGRRVSNNIIKKLGYGNIPHHIPHSPVELRRIGLPIRRNVPKNITTLFNILITMS